MDIRKYRQPQPALEFVSMAFEEFAGLHAEEIRDPNRDQKDFVEEIVPLAYLAKHLLLPWRAINCQFVGGPSNHDGLFSFSGPEVGAASIPRQVLAMAKMCARRVLSGSCGSSA